MGDVLEKFAKFTPDFMSAGRGHNREVGREALWSRSLCALQL